MKTKQITLPDTMLLLVELPEGAQDLATIETDQSSIPYGKMLMWYSTDEKTGYLQGETVSLPEGNWSILSRADEVTEVMAEEIVNSTTTHPKYWNYNLNYYREAYALESLDSLYRANEVYWQNPLGPERPAGKNTLDLVPFEYAKESLKNAKERWDNYQKNVWDKSRTYILIKQ